jgi:hypothetical protein
VTRMDEFLPESETGTDGVVPGQLDTIVADRTIIETGEGMLMAAYDVGNFLMTLATE